MRTAEQIAVMQASLEGKRIEWTRPRDPEWQPLEVTESYCWNWEDFIYRVAEPAPEPRIFEASVHKITGKLYAREKRDEYRGSLYELLTLTEIPPGWKLVPPVEPTFDPGYDYFRKDGEWRRIKSPHNAQLESWHVPTSKWSFAGLYSRFDLKKQGWTLTHAANFGEVAHG